MFDQHKVRLLAHKMRQQSNYTLRVGQSVYTAAMELYPMLSKHMFVHDCFYFDSMVQPFLNECFTVCLDADLL